MNSGPTDFCRYCGASIPKRPGEGTCPKCDPVGVKMNNDILKIKESELRTLLEDFSEQVGDFSKEQNKDAIDSFIDMVWIKGE